MGAMGTLHYGSASYEVADATLRHFSAVAVSKMRRNEPFLVLVRDGDDGIERVWLHASCDLRIETKPTTEPLDPARLEHMVREANRASGLDLCAAWTAPTRAVRR